jgi:hypothetical protein
VLIDRHGCPVEIPSLETHGEQTVQT